MKKVYSLLFALLWVGVASAQFNVTIQVDMNGVTVSPNGVHVAGDFQDEAGFPSDWDPSSATLTDGNNDGIYDLTVTIPGGRYEFKFINDNGWAGVESVPAVAQVEEGNGNDNRYMFIHQDTTLPAVAIGGSAPAGHFFVKFKSDLRNHLQANHVPNMMGSWNSFSDPIHLFDPEGDSIYYNYHYLASGNYEWKVRDTLDWCCAESVTDTACGGAGGFGNDRKVAVSQDMIMMPHCWGSCGPCVAGPVIDSVNVTFQVDLSNVCPPDVDSVAIAGNINGWPAPGDLLTDMGNGIWAITIELPNNTNHEYKFQTIHNGSVTWEGIANRVLNFTTTNDTTIAASCFNSTTPCGPSVPPANVTFRVDMSQAGSVNDVFVMGDFTLPNWQDGALQMTLVDPAGIYEVTEEVCQETFFYKFVNGDVSVPANEEFDGDTAVTCAEPNGIGGWNRKVTRTSGNDTTLTTWIFSTCDASTVGIDELGKGPEFSVYPNPFENSTTIEFAEVVNENYTVVVSDVTGKVVKEITNLRENRVVIHRENMETGIYLLQVSNANGARTVKKLVVK